MGEAQPNIQDFETVETVETFDDSFKVTDDSSAEWAVRKLAGIRAKQSENQSIADAENSRVKEWLEKVNSDLESNAQYFEAILHPYALQQRASGRKSVVLPHGTLKTVSGRQKIEVEESQFIRWATVNASDLIRIKTEVAKDEIKKLITPDGVAISSGGEILPFVTVTQSEPTVSIVVNK